MWIALFFLVIGSIAFYLIYKNRAGAPSDSAKSRRSELADIPSRVLNPGPYKGIRSIVAWEFVAPNLSVACPYARNNAGVRKQPDDCAGLPLNDCGSTSCLCHYRPVFEQRKGQRRQLQERRTALRFDASEDRRVNGDRRKDQNDWHDKHLK